MRNIQWQMRSASNRIWTPCQCPPRGPGNLPTQTCEIDLQCAPLQRLPGHRRVVHECSWRVRRGPAQSTMRGNAIGTLVIWGNENKVNGLTDVTAGVEVCSTGEIDTVDKVEQIRLCPKSDFTKRSPSSTFHNTQVQNPLRRILIPAALLFGLLTFGNVMSAGDRPAPFDSDDWAAISDSSVEHAVEESASTTDQQIFPVQALADSPGFPSSTPPSLSLGHLTNTRLSSSGSASPTMKDRESVSIRDSRRSNG